MTNQSKNAITPTFMYLFIKSQWKCENQFSVHNECNSGSTWRQLGLLYSSFLRLI